MVVAGFTQAALLPHSSKAPLLAGRLLPVTDRLDRPPTPVINHAHELQSAGRGQGFLDSLGQVERYHSQSPLARMQRWSA